MSSKVNRVFVSSTSTDLLDEREAVIKAVNDRRRFKAVAMEGWGSIPEPPLEACLAKVRGCDLYVGIFGGRRGSGITEEEYREAHAAGMPCFIYLKEETAAPLEADRRRSDRVLHAAFRKELEAGHVCKRFENAYALANYVSNDLLEWLYERDGDWMPPPDFVGRRREIEVLRDALHRGSGRACITGADGVGKSTLAAFVAGRLRALQRRALVFIRDPASFALPAGLEGLAERYSEELDGGQAVVVLEDAADEAQLGKLRLPHGCALLVTSREELSPAGFSTVRLDPLEPLEARRLILRFAPRLGRREAERITKQCGYLPLAVKVAGGLLSVADELTPADYDRRLRDERDRAKQQDGGAGGPAWPAFGVTYDWLKPKARRVFRQLAVFPGSFDEAAGAAVCVDGSAGILRDLRRLNVVAYEEGTGRYRLHGLARLYAFRCLSAREREAARRRHALHYAGEAAFEIGDLCRRPEAREQGLELFEAEGENLRAAREWFGKRAAVDGEAAAACLRCLGVLEEPLFLRGDPAEQAGWLEAALAASRRLGQRRTEGRCLQRLGNVYSRSDPRRAEGLYRDALKAARSAKDRGNEASALGGLGNLYESLGQPAEAAGFYEKCGAILRGLEDWAGAGHVLNNLGALHRAVGNFGAAVKCHKSALQVARKAADPRAEVSALCSLGADYVYKEDIARAIKCFEPAVSIAEGLSDLRGKAAALTGLGNAHSALGKHAEAIKYYRQALSISLKLNDRSGEGTALGNLGNEHAATGKIKEAIEFHTRALKISRELGELRSMIEDLTNLGHACYLARDFKKALKYHLRALRASRKVGALYYEATAHWNIARVCAEGEGRRGARAHAEVAHAILDRLGLPLAVEVREFLDELGEE